MAKAVIIGAGLMGSAMSWPLSDNGHDVALVGTHLDDAIIEVCKGNGAHPKLFRRLPESVKPYYFHELDEALVGANLILGGVSSPGVDWLAEVLSTRVKAHQQVMMITKGLHIDKEGNIALFPDIVANRFPESIRKRVFPVAVGGPCIAGELAAKRHTCVMFGSRDLEAATTCAKFFTTHYYHIQPTDKLLSLEICVA